MRRQLGDVKGKVSEPLTEHPEQEGEKPEIDTDRLAQWMTAARSIAIERARSEGYAAGRRDERERASQIASKVEIAAVQALRLLAATPAGCEDDGEGLILMGRNRAAVDILASLREPATEPGTGER